MLIPGLSIGLRSEVYECGASCEAGSSVIGSELLKATSIAFCSPLSRHLLVVSDHNGLRCDRTERAAPDTAT